MKCTDYRDTTIIMIMIIMPAMSDSWHSSVILDIRQVLTIAEIVFHPSYDFDTSANDIALLKVFMMLMS